MHMYVRTYVHIAATNMFQDVSGGLEPALAAEKEEDHYTATVCFGDSLRMLCNGVQWSPSKGNLPSH